MLTHHQTVINKETNKLCIITDYRFNEKVNRYKRGYVKILDENNKKPLIKMDNITHINDWSGRPICGKCNGKVDLSLRKYITTKKIRKQKKKEFFNNWYKELLKKADNINNIKINSWARFGGLINCWYADGSVCGEFKDYFIKKIKAKPLFKNIKLKHKKNKYDKNKIIEPMFLIFKHNKKKFLIIDSFSDTSITEFDTLV